MPYTDKQAVRLQCGSISEVCRELLAIMQREGNDEAPLQIEVGLSGGHTFIGAKAMTVRVEMGGRVVLSADEVR